MMIPPLQYTFKYSLRLLFNQYVINNNGSWSFLSLSDQGSTYVAMSTGLTNWWLNEAHADATFHLLSILHNAVGKHKQMSGIREGSRRAIKAKERRGTGKLAPKRTGDFY